MVNSIIFGMFNLTTFLKLFVYIEILQIKTLLKCKVKLGWWKSWMWLEINLKTFSTFFAISTRSYTGIFLKCVTQLKTYKSILKMPINFQVLLKHRSKYVLYLRWIFNESPFRVCFYIFGNDFRDVVHLLWHRAFLWNLTIRNTIGRNLIMISEMTIWYLRQKHSLLLTAHQLRQCRMLIFIILETNTNSFHIIGFEVVERKRAIDVVLGFFMMTFLCHQLINILQIFHHNPK